MVCCSTRCHSRTLTNCLSCDIISKSLATQRFSMTLLGVFAALALLLASVGIYGVISYLVGQRTHEIGIRIALCAESLHILRLILGRGGILAVARSEERR